MAAGCGCVNGREIREVFTTRRSRARPGPPPPPKYRARRIFGSRIRDRTRLPSRSVFVSVGMDVERARARRASRVKDERACRAEDRAATKRPLAGALPSSLTSRARICTPDDSIRASSAYGRARHACSRARRRTRTRLSLFARRRFRREDATGRLRSAKNDEIARRRASRSRITFAGARAIILIPLFPRNAVTSNGGGDPAIDE